MNELRLFAAFEQLDTDFLRVRHRTGYKYMAESTRVSFFVNFEGSFGTTGPGVLVIA